MKVRCGCVWAGGRCPNQATAEDGLCDWCAGCGARSHDELRSSPSVILGPDGEVLGLGGRGQAHIDVDRRPDACWMPGSGREVAPPEPWMADT